MANDSNAPASGQVPATGASPQGQVPPTSPVTPPTSGQVPPPSGDSGDSLTPEQLRDALTKARADAAKARVDAKRLADLEAQIKAAEDAKLSESEKATKRLAELEQTNTTQARELTELKLTRAIERQAATLNIIDPDAAVKLLDWAEIDFDASGAPKNIDKLLAALVQAKPWLVGSAASGQRPLIGSGGATNPGAGARPGTFTREQIGKMSTREFEQNRPAIMEALRQGAIRP